MRVLVIGATGYLGSRIVAALLAGHEVAGIARSPQATAQLRELGVTPLECDLADPTQLGALVREMDATIFAARLIRADSGWAFEQSVVRTIIDALAGTGKTFLFTSGTGVLGHATYGEWSEQSHAEEDPFDPPEIARTRVDTELLIRAAAGRGVRAMVIRPPAIWGYQLYSIGLYIHRSIVATGTACYLGQGLNCYSSVHVDDLTDLYRRALEQGSPGALYHAVSGEFPNRWIAETIARAADVPVRSIFREEGARLWGSYACDIVMGASSRSRAPRARGELGWSPSRFDLPGELDLLVRRAGAGILQVDRR